MILYHFFLHPEDYEDYGEDEEMRPILEPKETASKEAIHSYYRYIVESKDERIVAKPKEMCERMVKAFKESKYYSKRSKAEKEEIIAYLMAHPERA